MQLHASGRDPSEARLVLLLVLAALTLTVTGIALLAFPADVHLVAIGMDERGWWWCGVVLFVLLAGVAVICAVARRIRRRGPESVLAAVAVVGVTWLAAIGPLLHLETICFPDEYRVLTAAGKKPVVIREQSLRDGSVRISAGSRSALLVRFGEAKRVLVDPRYGLDAWRFEMKRGAVLYSSPADTTGSGLLATAAQDTVGS